MAIAGDWLTATYNRPGYELFDFNVYALCGDGDMMEGVASEAASLGRVCYFKELYATSARFWFDAFRLQPGLAEDGSADRRYNAAGAAASLIPSACSTHSSPTISASRTSRKVR